MGPCSSVCKKPKKSLHHPKSRLPQDTNQMVYFDRLSSSQIQLLRQKFQQYQQKGFLDWNSFLLLFPSLKNFSDNIQQFAFKAFDINDCNKISYQDLCYVISKYILGKNEQKVTFLFDLFDTERKGVLKPRQVVSLQQYVRDRTQREIFHSRSSSSSSLSLQVFKQEYFSDFQLIKLLEPFELVPSPETEKLTVANLINKCMRLGEKWNLISRTWMKAWKKYVGFQQEEVSEEILSSRESRINQKPIEIDNSPLQGEFQVELKIGIQEGKDYEIIPSQVWTALKNWYGGGPEFQREVVLKNQKLVLDLYPTIFRVKVTGSKKHSEPEILIVNEQKKIEEIIQILSQKLGSDSESSLFELRGDHYKLLQPSWYIKNFGFQGVVNCILTANSTAEQETFPFEIIDQETFEEGQQVEVLQNGHWMPFQIQKCTSSEYNLRCLWNQNSLVLMKHNTEIIRRPLKVRLKAERGSDVKGITNIGNTCYTGTVLQSLFHTPMLKTYFVSQSYKKHLNIKNSQSSKGKISNQVAALFQEITDTQIMFVNPGNLLKEFTKIHLQFEGNHQQDSHEFLRALLDSLHEDLNRKKSQKSYSAKTITLENPDLETEKEVSKKQWTDIQGNVGSVISDFCGGQTRQKIECSNCGNFKVVFQTFMDISIPIPIKQQKNPLKVFFIPKNTNYIQKYTFQVTEDFQTEDFITQICLHNKIKPRNLLIGKVRKSLISKFFEPSDELQKILPSSKQKLFVYQHTQSVKQAQLDGKNVPIKSRKSLSKSNILDKVDVFTNGKWVTGTISKIKGDEVKVILDIRTGKKIKTTIDSTILARYRKYTEIHEPLVYSIQVFMGFSIHGQTKLFGQPLILSIGNWYNWSDLIQKVKNLCKLYCYPTASNYHILSNTLSMILLKSDTFHCAICNSNRCDGCKIQPYLQQLALFPEILQNSSICVYWKNPEIYLLRKAIKVQNSDIYNIHECLQEFISKERIEMNCENCQSKEMETQTEIWRLPDILIIHLKRFHYKKLAMHKITNLVDFPLSKLNLRDFMLSNKTQLGITVSNSQHNFEYELYSVINHVGSALGGHYTCFSLNEGATWLEYDDDRVFQLNRTDEIVTQKAYILFYRRKRFTSCNLINLSGNGFQQYVSEQFWIPDRMV